MISTGDCTDAAPDLLRRKLLTQATVAAGGLALVGASTPFIASLAPSARARSAGAPVEASFEQLAPGELRTQVWRGKPVWILRRSKEMLAGLESDRSFLTDPDSTVRSQQPDYARNPGRARRPELFVAVGLCTHLGCIPTYMPEPGSVQSDWPGGFYCPCHGSKFDLAGRVFKGSPAPTNLVIPPYRFEGDVRLVIGDDAPKVG